MVNRRLKFELWILAAGLAGGGVTTLVLAGQLTTAACAAFGAATLACIVMAVRAGADDTPRAIAIAAPQVSAAIPLLTLPEGTTVDQDDIAVYVENVGDAAARNVRVQPITFSMGQVDFRPIPGVLRPKDRVPLEVERVSSDTHDHRKYDDLGQLWRIALGQNCWLKFATRYDATVPISITFRDEMGRNCTERQTITLGADRRILTRSNTPRVKR